MLNRISKDDCSSLITKLIRKTALVLINSRSSNQDKINKVDDTFLLLEKKNNDYLDDCFTDDYGNKDQSSYNSFLFFLEFYYHRQGFKCLLEKWTFNYSTIKNNQMQINWKESVMFIRSMYILARTLPSYAINRRKDKLSGKIDYRLYLNEKNKDDFSLKTSKVFKTQIGNRLIKVEIEYLSIEDFDKLDNENLNANSKNDNQIKQRQRHFSLDEKKMKPLYEVMACYKNNNLNFIDEDYFSNDSGCSLKHTKNNNSTTDNQTISKDLNNAKRKTTFFNPLSARGNAKSPLDKSSSPFPPSSSSSPSSSSHSSNNSFQLDIVACNEDPEENQSKLNLVLKEKKPSMTNLRLEAKEDWIEIIAEGIGENISSIVSNFSLLKTSLQQRTKATKVNVVNLTQFYSCFLIKR